MPETTKINKSSEKKQSLTMAHQAKFVVGGVNQGSKETDSNNKIYTMYDWQTKLNYDNGNYHVYCRTGAGNGSGKLASALDWSDGGDGINVKDLRLSRNFGENTKLHLGEGMTSSEMMPYQNISGFSAVTDKMAQMGTEDANDTSGDVGIALTVDNRGSDGTGLSYGFAASSAANAGGNVNTDDTGLLSEQTTDYYTAQVAYNVNENMSGAITYTDNDNGSALGLSGSFKPSGDRSNSIIPGVSFGLGFLSSDTANSDHTTFMLGLNFPNVGGQGDLNIAMGSAAGFKEVSAGDDFKQMQYEVSYKYKDGDTTIQPAFFHIEGKGATPDQDGYLVKANVDISKKRFM